MADIKNCATKGQSISIANNRGEHSGKGHHFGDEVVGRFWKQGIIQRLNGKCYRIKSIEP